MAFLDDVPTTGGATATAPATPSAPAASGGFLSDVPLKSLNAPAPTATSTPVASGTAATSTPNPVTPKNTGGMFSNFMTSVGNFLNSDYKTDVNKVLTPIASAISKATTAPTQTQLEAGPGGGKNTAINTARLLPSELARSIPGVADIQDDSDNITQGANAPDFYAKVIAPQEASLNKQKAQLDAMKVNKNDKSSVDAYNAAVASYNATFNNYNRNFTEYQNVAASDKANGTEGKQQNLGIAHYIDAADMPGNIGTAAVQTAKGIAAMPIKAAADVWDTGRVWLGAKPNASFTLPVLGKVSSDIYDVVDRINNGQDPWSAAISAGSSSIFNVLFFADIANRVAGTRVTTTGKYQGDFNNIKEGVINNPGPKTGRLYEPKTVYNKGGAQVIPPEALAKMKEQGVPFGKNYDPNSPTFFRVTQGKGGAYTAEVMQLKPSYLETAFNKVFGAKEGPTNIPSILGVASAKPEETNPAEMQKIASDAKPSDIETVHSESVKESAITDSMRSQIEAEKPLYHGANAETAASIRQGGFRGSEDFPGHGMVSLTSDPEEAHNYATLDGKEGEVLQANVSGKTKTYESMDDYTRAIENARGATSGEREMNANKGYNVIRIKEPNGKRDIVLATPSSVKLADSSAVAPSQKMPFIPVSHTVVHNMLRLGGGDVADAGAGASILNTEIQQHLREEGELATHTALMEKLGVDAHTANELINQARPKPVLAQAVTEFGSDLATSHGTLKSLNPKQATKMSAEDAEAPAKEAAQIYWDSRIQPAIDRGEPIVIGGDDLKDFFGNDYNDNNHPVYSKAANDLFTRALNETDSDQVVFTGGGPGSGKTELLVSHMKTEGFTGIIYDSNFSNLEGAKRQIEEARKSGKSVDLYGVIPNLQNSRGFTVMREFITGRGITDNTFAHGHSSFPAVVKALLEEGILKPDEVHLVDTRDVDGLDKAKQMVKEGGFMTDPLANLTNLAYNKDEIKTQYAKDNYDKEGNYTGAATRELQEAELRKEAGDALEESGANKEVISPYQPGRPAYAPMRGFINPGAIAEPIIEAAKQVGDYIEQAEKTTELTGTVNDAIYQHEGNRKAMRQRAIQLLQAKGSELTAEQWERLYHYDENPTGETITPAELAIYKDVVVPLKDALTKARDEYRSLGGHITQDLQSEESMTPRYAKEKGGPIDKALRQIKEGTKQAIGVANGGLLSKSVAGGAKHRIFHALEDADGNRTVVSIPNAKDSKITAFKNGVLTDLGPKSGMNGKTFTAEDGTEYKVTQATTKEIEANTKTRYHKNVLANYVLAFDRTNNALSALKLLERIKNTPEFGDIIVKEDPEVAPPAGWQLLTMPQFRGYYAEPKLWEALEDLSNRLKGREPFPVVDEINNLLTSLIVLNPIMHFPNVAQGWATAQAADGVIPGVTPNSAKNFARAFNAVKNKDELYLSYLEHGAPLMALKNTASEFTKAVLEQYSDEVESEPTQWQALSDKLGYANPAAWFKGLMHLNETATWGGNDIMFLHAILDAADRNNLTPLEAIKLVSKRMADYRMPSRIGPGKLGRAVSKFAQGRGFLFARYHYSGVIKPWIESIGDAAGPKSSWQQRRQGLRALAYLGLMALIVYPFIDKLLQGLTGNPLTYVSDAGPTKLVQNVQKLSQAGAPGVPAFLGSMFTPSPAVTAAIELGFNVDLYTRDPIYSNPQNEGLGGFTTSMISPAATAGRMTPGEFALSLLGIYSPKNAQGKNALNAQKYDELPLLQAQVKKDINAGNVAKANAEMKDFNDRAIANYNADMLAQGKKPLAADGSENDAFLKEWGIKAPGAKALSDAAKLYGDGSLTSKSSLVDRVVTYAKALGTDPVDTFNAVFHSQQIVAVDNASFLNPDAAVIVQRDDNSESSARKSFGTAAGYTPEQMAGLQLDHIIPLEDGGINNVKNYQLVSSYNNEVLHGLVENPISAALKAGTISRAHAREYIIRYKAGTLGEALTPAMLSEYQTKYNSQPITAAEVADLIASGKAK